MSAELVDAAAEVVAAWRDLIDKRIHILTTGPANEARAWDETYLAVDKLQDAIAAERGRA